MCAHAVSVALKKLEGVKSVKVSLNKGWADVILKPGNKVTLDHIREAIRKNGFTPKGADVRVAGIVIEREGGLVLEVSGLELVYRLTDHGQATGRTSELLASAREKRVVASGHVPESPKAAANGPAVLQLRDFTPSGP